jgi:hypothetical protein
MTTLIEPLRIATSRDAGDGTCDESGELRGRRAGGAPAAAAEHGTDGPAAGRRPPRRSPRDGAGSRGCTPPASARRGSLGSPLASRVPSDAALVRGFAWAASTPPPRPPVSCALWCAVAAKPNGAIPIVASSLPFGCGSAFAARFTPRNRYYSSTVCECTLRPRQYGGVRRFIRLKRCGSFEVGI